MKGYLRECIAHLRELYRPKTVIRRTYCTRNIMETVGYGKIKNSLLLLDESVMHGNIRMQIECLSNLAAYNVGFVDDRIMWSLNCVKDSINEKWLDRKMMVKYIDCLHKFGEVSILRELMPRILHEFYFMPPVDVSRLTRIYAMHFKDSVEFKDLRMKMLGYLNVQWHDIGLDHMLTCVLSCFHIPECLGLARSALKSYVENLETLDVNNIKTLQTILTALRLNRRLVSYSKESFFPAIEEKSLLKTIDFLELSHDWKSRDGVNTVTRICIVLSIALKENMKLELCRLVRMICEYSSNTDSEILTTRSNIYLINAISLVGDNTLQGVKSWLVERIKPHLPMLTSSEIVLLTNCIDEDNDYMFLQHIICLMDELTPKDLVKVMKFYSKYGHASPHFIEKFKDKFCEVWRDMEPKELTCCLNYLVKMNAADRLVLLNSVRYIYDHSIDLGAKDVACLLSAFYKAGFNPSKSVIKILYHLIKRDIHKMELWDLAKCIRFAFLQRNAHHDLFNVLLNDVEKKLELYAPPCVICNLVLSLFNFKNRRFNTILFSAAYETMKYMTHQQLGQILYGFRHSGLSNDNILRKVCHHLIVHNGALDYQESYDALSAVKCGKYDKVIESYSWKHKIASSLQRFLMEGGSIDVNGLKSSEILQCIYSIGNKTRNRETNNTVKQLCSKICKMGSLITPSVARRIMYSLTSYGYKKPKIWKKLTNRVAALTTKSGHKGISKTGLHDLGSHGKQSATIFRRIELGPPHLSGVKVRHKIVT
ncbi:hypothetical protein BgAZ_304290 [Babesia gibsoni]|uniref:Uncharacterized protein n=1 Tax=Babesia gibsoni TaxID=33632 RepID=A0AAD8LPM8_BABGI|nr:hypothetical protein BgAZ_304290 [Babesia gibsoni]